MAEDMQITGDLNVLENLLQLTGDAVEAGQAVLDLACGKLKAELVTDGKLDAEAFDQAQTATHGLAWFATTIQALRQLHLWAVRLDGQGQFGECEQLILQIGFGETLWQLYGGVPMAQGELVRLQDLGLSQEDQRGLMQPAVMELCARGNTQAARLRLVALLREKAGQESFAASGLDDEYEMIRTQFWRFSQDKVVPFAHQWHLDDAYIPAELIQEMAELGVFGLTIPEEYGGFGMSKTAMCVVSEELSRGYIGVGSLGTRSEIAAELIIGGGSEEQKQHWLPRLSSAEILPTAVFTEPNTGSDLGALRTRAVKDSEDWRITGNKTWITHAARAHLMTLLARTDPETTDYKGLSMFLAEKTPGNDSTPFPDAGISGGEIEVLGYRGMKEFELGFDNFHVSGDNLLGSQEGQGFKQLMRTFESARIQTAARAVGVAQSAFDLGMRYAEERQQFGKSLIAFPRIASKLAMMAVEITMARQLTYFSAREKDADHRCDVEAGMAKLLGARVAWMAADQSLQIHGGNGFALEYEISRVLCDARILNIFEGAAEIQAQVVARRLLTQ